MTQLVGFISWWPEWLFRGFQLSCFCCGSPAELIRFHGPPMWFLLVCLYLFCFADGYVATNHLWLLAKVSVDDILLQVFIIVHTYIHIYIHTYTHTHTNTHKVLPREYYSRHLLISSYHKSDQQISTFY